MNNTKSAKPSYLNRVALKNKLPNEARDLAKQLEQVLIKVKGLREEGVLTQTQYEYWCWYVIRSGEDLL